MPVEYSGEEQAICAVALAKPPAGTFSPSTHFLLALATVGQTALLGVTTGPGGRGDPPGMAL